MFSGFSVASCVYLLDFWCLLNFGFARISIILSFSLTSPQITPSPSFLSLMTVERSLLPRSSSSLPFLLIKELLLNIYLVVDSLLTVSILLALLDDLSVFIRRWGVLKIFNGFFGLFGSILGVNFLGRILIF